QHFSLHPAQIRELAARGEPGAIDHRPPGEHRRRGFHAEADGNPEFPEPRCERRECRARVEMSLVPEIQPLTETTREVRFEARKVFRPEGLKMPGAAGKLGEIRRIAAMRHHQRAIDEGAGEALLPPGDTLRTEARDQWTAALQLTPRRQHAAREPGALGCAELRAALEDLDGDAALGELQRAGEACDPGP